MIRMQSCKRMRDIKYSIKFRFVYRPTCNLPQGSMTRSDIKVKQVTNSMIQFKVAKLVNPDISTS